jgi:predicted HicB family RNase H-like nuclease
VPVLESQRRAIDKYDKEKIDHLKVRMAKGKKAVLQEHASNLDESLNKFVNRAIDETIERDNQLLG